MPLYQLIIAVVVVIAIGAVVFILHRKRVQKERIQRIYRIAPTVNEALDEVCSYFKFGHYITESERLYLSNKYINLTKMLKPLVSSKELSKSPEKENFERLFKALSKSKENKDTNNKEFIERQLEENKEYFDSVLAYPLDQQQREAVVTLEDNVLVISSAGSGKTMTTVGKVRYLIDKQNVSPEKILLITFTRKAAESLSERLGEKNLKCRTFHKLALEIITESTGEKPSIVPPDFSVQVYHKLFNDNDDFKLAVLDYVMMSRYTMKDQFDYQTRSEYIKDRKKHGVRAYYSDMDGKPVFCKSEEESRICDFLGSRGIKFRYEESYQYDVSDPTHRQYTPDFSVYYEDNKGHTKRLYIEHFAVNESGHCPKWFGPGEEGKYKEGIKWKRDLHNSKGTILLETTSAGFHKGDVFEKLTSDLQNQGVKFNIMQPTAVLRKLELQEENILNTLTAFNFLMKSRNLTIEDVLRKRTHGKDRIILKNLVAPFIDAYNRTKETKREIDFTDAIIGATHLCNNGHRPDYDYILVDEFQDISLDRYYFLMSLRKSFPLTKLFCVGDDWQSIYRFAGSDMTLFKHFKEYFGYTKTCLMETTYRFGEPSIGESSNFILANPEQARKTVKPFNEGASTKLTFISVDQKEDFAKEVQQIISQIPINKSILLVGRYNFDVNVFEDSPLQIRIERDGVYVKCEGRKIPFMTVHQSKGLESDYIILINCKGGTLGFPSNIDDSPILKYVLSDPDIFPYSEERRLFYVAITRAKTHTFVLYDKNNPSPFVKEFKPGVNKADTDEPKTEVIPQNLLCPKCRCGKITVVKKGIASNGTPYKFVVCSNQKYGCDYQEVIFYNKMRIRN